MGLLVNGKWQDKWYDTDETERSFSSGRNRNSRDWVTKDGNPVEGSSRGFKAEPGRYHLYVSYACPWAHRTLIFRKLKKLEDVISYSVVHHFMGENGWTSSRKMAPPATRSMAWSSCATSTPRPTRTSPAA